MHKCKGHSPGRQQTQVDEKIGGSVDHPLDVDSALRCSEAEAAGGRLRRSEAGEAGRLGSELRAAGADPSACRGRIDGVRYTIV